MTAMWWAGTFAVQPIGDGTFVIMHGDEFVRGGFHSESAAMDWYADEVGELLSPAEKRDAALVMLEEQPDLSCRDVADRFEISPKTLAAWKRKRAANARPIIA